MDDIRDTESIAIDGDGTMWLSDLGDNDTKRDDAALYAFPEPGPGDHSVTAKRYPVSYDTGPVDVEAFLVHPKTGAKVLASKEKKKPGTLYALPEKLSETSPNVATDLGKPVPEDVSDGTYSIDGTQALLRTRDAVFLVDPGTWQQVGTLDVPKVEQGESIAMEPGGTSFIIGSEGKNSPADPGGRSAPTRRTSPPRPHQMRSRQRDRRRRRMCRPPPGWWSSAGSLRSALWSWLRGGSPAGADLLACSGHGSSLSTPISRSATVAHPWFRRCAAASSPS